MTVDNCKFKLNLKKFIVINNFFYKFNVNNYVDKFLMLSTY